MTKTVQLTKVSGKKAIGSNDLVYCNTKYHKPYLAVISPGGGMDWQEKLYTGYGKNRETYYSVEALKPGDYIQAAGGSGGNKYPFKGKVIEVTETVLIVEEVTDAEFSNKIAERKAKVEAIVKSFPATFTEEEQRLITQLKSLSVERQRLVLAEVMQIKVVAQPCQSLRGISLRGISSTAPSSPLRGCLSISI